MILITGATGLAGSHIALELLKRGKKIRATKRKNTSLSGLKKIFNYYSQNQATEYLEKIQWIEADILDVFSLEKAFEGITEVYHAAGMVDFSPKNLDLLYKINVEGTKNMVNLALKNKIQKFCHLSSVAVFSKEKNLIKETYLFKKSKKNPYAYSKYLSEMELWRASGEGLNIVVVNPSVILAPGFWKEGSGKILDQISKKGIFYTKGSTGYIDARDVAFCSVELMDKNYLNKHYILNSENLYFKEIISHIRARFDLRPPLAINKFFLQLISIMGSFFGFLLRKKNFLSLSIVNSITSESFYSNEKIKETISHQFIPILEALDTHIEFYKKEFFLEKKTLDKDVKHS